MSKAENPGGFPALALDFFSLVALNESMRITGGRARGIILKIPQRSDLRPATGFLREAVFSSLGPRVQGARVLDVFAGTGAYGLEALSRGAAHAVWVDANPTAVTAIRANLTAVAKAMDGADALALGKAVEGDAFTWQPPTGAVFDLVFVDPPYTLLPKFGEELLKRASAWLPLNSEARLVLEAHAEYEPTPLAGWELTRRLGGGGRQPNSLIFRRLV